MTPERRVYSVSDLTRRIKQTLEDEFGRVWVEGEISNYKVYASGHAYFSLKDAGAQLRAVLFAGSRGGVAAGARLADGQRIRAYGEVSVFESRGDYQLIVRKAEPLGDGDLMLRFAELKRKLQDEGLFDAARKRPLPKLPQRIAIVTSATGAVIHDILNVLGRRFPNVQVRLAPVKVQGVGAAQEIAAAVGLFNRVCGAGSAWPADVLIVGRGGGSLEDLWAFNEEAVARAVAGSAIPVISAVGHETDFSLCDFAADVRAPTPSAAAEQVVETKCELEREVARFARALRQALRQRAAGLDARLAAARASRFLRHPRQLAERFAQRIDTLAMRLDHAARQRAQAARGRAERAAGRLRAVRERRAGLLDARLALDARRLDAACRLRLERLRARVAGVERQLALLSPLAVLDRGYSLTRGADGALVRSAGGAAPGARLVTQVRDGVIRSVVD
ncbi:MAG: exodeoxyribonuclease VII large subunit [Verrucomicrobiota bacterium]|jgi:exodeoxyribonuclease VII large subunit|nr:exodeoxyribonuclease VII large subunit [Verrucomicrobiota bacterium]